VEGATLRLGRGGGLIGGGGRPTAAPRPARGTTHAAPSSSPQSLLAALRVSLDASLVTHATGHALLPALAAAGIPHRVSREDHPLTSAGVRTITFSRAAVGGGGGGGGRSATGPGVGENAPPPPPPVEEAIPYVLACLTAPDFVALCDAAVAAGGAGVGAATATPADLPAGAAARAGLARLAAAAAAAHPHAILGLVIEGLDTHLTARERADVAAGRAPRRAGAGPSPHAAAAPAAFVRRPYDRAAAIAAVHCPGVRLRLVLDAGAAADHACSIAAALATSHVKQARATCFVAAFSGDTAAGTAAVAAAAAAPDAADPAVKARAAAARALARLPGVPPAAAAAIAAAHGTFGRLVSWAGAVESGPAAVAALADLRTTGGRGGRVGPAAARRVVAFTRATDGRADVEM